MDGYPEKVLLSIHRPLVPVVTTGASLEPQRSQRNILFSFAAERAANEKQSASGGSINANLLVIHTPMSHKYSYKLKVRTSINTHNENFPKGCYFFLSALSAERKKKLKLSVLCGSNEHSEWAVKNFKLIYVARYAAKKLETI